MTPRQIAALTAAEMEHSGHQLTAADVREIERNITDQATRRARFIEMLKAPAYQWKKPQRLR